MTPIGRGLCWMHWLFRIALLLPLSSFASEQGANDIKLLHMVQQRLTLASHLIERMDSELKAAFSSELETLQTRFLLQIDQALADDANAFFRRVMNTYRAGLSMSQKVDSDAQRMRYGTKLRELGAFRESFAVLVQERGEEARAVLDEAKLASRIERAASLAGDGDYSGAYALADGAYHQLIEALRVLRDKETIEYSLDFATPADEYRYEIRRFKSQKMLLDMVVAEKRPPMSSIALIDELVEIANTKMREAEALDRTGRTDQAIEQQEQAIEALTKAMRVAGVYF